jgi:eukaryotic-like serine/threonine-protein kinase
MDPERWKRVDGVLQAALALPAEQQGEFLHRECANDPELLEEVRSLVSSDRGAESFLAQPIANFAEHACSISTALTREEEASPATARLTGQTISHYRILERIGRGGMGEVYEAEDITLGRRVAMKFLPGNVSRDRKAYERMQREARSASALDHPNICSIYELGEHDGQPFIVMQLLEGVTLRTWIERTFQLGKRSHINAAIDLAIQITRGLEEAHKKNIIHRDIKPANIFVTDRGEAKILDFGLAKVVEPFKESEPLHDAPTAQYPQADLNLTQTGVQVGTVFYMSPEQIRGEKLDARTDLFSFGLVLFEMVSGRRAFKGSTGAEVHSAVLHGAPQAVRQLNHTIPSGVESVIRRSLERDRDRRYQSAKDLRADLDRLRTHRSPSFSTITAKIAAVALLLFLAGLGANLGGLRDRLLRGSKLNGVVEPSNRRTAVAVLGFKNLSGREDKAWISTALSEMLDAQLSAGQELRVVSSEDVARMKIDLSLPAADSYSRDTLQRIRKHLGADIVVLGSYLDTGRDSGGKIRVDVRLQDAGKGETIAVVSRDGDETTLPDLATQSGASLRHNLGVADISATEASQTAASESANPEATRLYAEGLAKLQAYDALDARDLLEKAIAADPKYALSHTAMAQAWSQLGYEIKATEEAKKAFELSDHLTREQHLAVEGRYREYAHDFPAAIEIYRTLRNFFPDNLNYALRLASSQLKAGHPKDSLETIAQTRTLPKPISDDARIDLAEASAQNAAGNFSACQKAAAGATAKAKAQGSRMIQTQATLAEAFAWDRLGDLTMAIQKSIEARDLAANAGNPDLLGRAFMGYGMALFDKGNYPEARKAFEQALITYKEIGDSLIAPTLSDLGNVCYEQGKLEDAERYYRDALKNDQEAAAQPARIGSDMGSIANVLDGLGDLAGATRMQEQSLQGFRDGGDQRGESDTLDNLALVLVERGELSQAMADFQKGAALAEKIGYKRGLAGNLQGMVTVFLDRDQLSQARNREGEVLKIRKELDDSGQLAESQIELANIALEQGKTSEAESLIRAAAPQFDQQSAAADASQSAALLARVFLAQSKIGDAEAASAKAMALSQQTSDRPTGIQATLAVAEVDESNGKVPSAAKALESVVNDSIRMGYQEYEFEARLELVRLELRSSRASGSQHLEKLEKDAALRDFRLISRKAREELNRDFTREQSGVR